MSYSLLLRLFTPLRLRQFFAGVVQACLVGFSTSSSAATLPITMKSAQNNIGVSEEVASVVLPLGATVNMDGTAVFECLGGLFIAQVLGFDLTVMQHAVVVLTALMASIGAAAVPSAGLVVIFIMLEAIGLTGSDVNVIVGSMLAIDRPLDMYRTAVKIFSDSCGAAVIARSEGETDVDMEIRSAVADG